MRKREEGEMGGVVGIIMTSGVVTPVGKGIREAYGAAPPRSHQWGKDTPNQHDIN